MNKMYTLTEENYKEVLARIQKMTNSYRMLYARQYNTVKSGIRTEDEEYGEPEYRHESWGKRNVFKGVDEHGKLIVSEEDFRDTCFVRVEEHAFKVYHDEDPNSSKGKEWESMKSLIRMEVAPDYVIVLTYGDKVKFEENGFSVYNDNEYTRFGRDLVVYQYTFIISQEDKITDLDSEIAHRDAEWDEYDEDYARIEHEAEERARELDCYDDDYAGSYDCDSLDDYEYYDYGDYNGFD